MNKRIPIETITEMAKFNQIEERLAYAEERIGLLEAELRIEQWDYDQLVELRVVLGLGPSDPVPDVLTDAQRKRWLEKRLAAIALS